MLGAFWNNCNLSIYDYQVSIVYIFMRFLSLLSEKTFMTPNCKMKFIDAMQWAELGLAYQQSEVSQGLALRFMDGKMIDN